MLFNLVCGKPHKHILLICNQTLSSNMYHVCRNTYMNNKYCRLHNNMDNRQSNEL